MSSSVQQGTLAVVSQTGESLTFFNLPSGKHIGKLDSLVSERHELCHDPKRNVLYVSHAYRHVNYWTHGGDSHEISVVDLATKTISSIIDTNPAKGPNGLYINHNRNILYSSVEVIPGGHGGGVIGIDLTTYKIVKTVPSDYRTHWFTMTPDGKKAYCCNKIASLISVLDLENERMIEKIEVAEGCEEPSMSLDGRFAYFLTPGYKCGQNPKLPRIEVIDTATDTIVRSIELEHGALPVHVSPSGVILAGHYVFGDNATGMPNSAHLGIYDGDHYQMLGQAPVDIFTLTIRCSADGRTAFVANVANGTVTVVDIHSKSVIRTIEVDAERRPDKQGHVGAHGLASIPA